MLLPRAARPKRAGLPLCPRKRLRAAMTAPRAARRGVRVRERAGARRARAGRWGERAPRRRGPRAAELGRGGGGVGGTGHGRARATRGREGGDGAEHALPGGGRERAGARLGSALLR